MPGSWVTLNQWGWILNSECATLRVSVALALRVEMNDTVIELVSWHISGSQPPMAGEGADLMGLWLPACNKACISPAVRAPQSVSINGADSA